MINIAVYKVNNLKYRRLQAHYLVVRVTNIGTMKLLLFYKMEDSKVPKLEHVQMNCFGSLSFPSMCRLKTEKIVYVHTGLPHTSLSTKKGIQRVENGICAQPHD